MRAAPGSKVRLRSGGPVMTVREVTEDGGVVAFWLRGEVVSEYEFCPAALEVISGVARESLN